jgi:hypothetical protein
MTPIRLMTAEDFERFWPTRHGIISARQAYALDPAAVARWQSLGFTIVACLPRAFRHAELGLVDCLLMYKAADPVPAQEPERARLIGRRNIESIVSRPRRNR